MSTINVKLQVESQLRRFSIESTTNFFQLKDKIKTILGIDQEFSVQYLDEENEWITVTSDSELNTGISLINKIFRLQVVAVHPLKIEGDVCSKGWKRKEWKKERKGGRRCGRKSNEIVNESTEKKDETVDDKKEDVDQAENCNEKDDCSAKGWKRKEWKKERKEWKKERKGGRRCGRRNDEVADDQSEKKSDQEDDCSFKGKKYGKKWGRRGSFKMQQECDVVSSESGDEKLTLEDIKKETKSIVDELALLKEKKKVAVDEMKKIKEKIGELRRNNGNKEEILALRNDAVQKRKEMGVFFIQIRNSKERISKLRSIAVTKE